MAKIGYFYLHRGEWDGRQMLPTGWTDAVFNASVDMGISPRVPFRYARGWWAIPDRHVVMAVGFLRQLIIIFPDLDIVAVVNGRGSLPARAADRSHRRRRQVAGAAGCRRCRRRATGGARAGRGGRAGDERRPGVAAGRPPRSPARRGRSRPNPFGVRSLKLDLASGEPRYEVLLDRAGGAPRRLGSPIGLDGLFRVHDDEAGLPMAAKGRWLNDHVFELVSRSITEGIVTTSTLDFHGREVDLAFSSNQGFTTRLTGRAGD